MNDDGGGVKLIAPTNDFDIRASWQPIPGPKRSEYKSANRFCKAEQAFWGNQFKQHYRNFGQCVSASK